MQHAEDGSYLRSTADRQPIVGIIGSGTIPHRDRATIMGSWLATQSVHLLTGGGGGVMETVSEAFRSVPERRGMVIGVLPGAVEGGRHRPLPGYPNGSTEIAIYTHLALSGSRGTETASRNHINVLTSDVIVALPGSQGTASEVRLALQYEKPLVAFLARRAEIPGLPDSVYVEPMFEKVKEFVRSHIW